MFQKLAKELRRYITNTIQMEKYLQSLEIFVMMGFKTIFHLVRIFIIMKMENYNQSFIQDCNCDTLNIYCGVLMIICMELWRICQVMEHLKK